MPNQEYVKSPGTEDEVDVFSILVNVYQFLRKCWKKLVIYSIVGAVLGTVIWIVTSPTYRAKMILDSRVLNNDQVASIIDSWQLMIRHREDALLAQKLNMPIGVVSAVRKIELSRQLSSGTGSTNTGFAFEITVTVTNKEVLRRLEGGIVFGLRNNEYALSRTNSNRKRLVKLKAKTQQEIARLDSTRLAITTIIETQKASALITDPGNINIRLVELYEKMLLLEEQLQFSNDIQVVEGFGEFATPMKLQLPLLLIAGLVTGCIAGLVSIFFRKLIAYSSSEYSTYNK